MQCMTGVFNDFRRKFAALFQVNFDYGIDDRNGW